ncbi:MAG TPA: hypothetical protein VNA68_00685 [Candidatus Dormibacteraeota bacterium]|nr:hypothetical protein [Candidatus Dormibacteraeota bacterium]
MADTNQLSFSALECWCDGRRGHTTEEETSPYLMYFRGSDGYRFETEFVGLRHLCPACVTRISEMMCYYLEEVQYERLYC